MTDVPRDLDPPQPGLVPVAWAMIRQMQAVAERLERAAAVIEGERARERRECGIPDHEFAEDAAG